MKHLNVCRDARDKKKDQASGSAELDSSWGCGIGYDTSIYPLITYIYIDDIYSQKSAIHVVFRASRIDPLVFEDLLEMFPGAKRESRLDALFRERLGDSQPFRDLKLGWISVATALSKPPRHWKRPKTP